MSYTSSTKSSRADKLNCVTVFTGSVFSICKKSFSKQIILSAIFLFIMQGFAWGQTTIWSENFIYANGTNTGSGSPSGVTSWTAEGSRNGTNYKGITVVSNQLRGRNTANGNPDYDAWEINTGSPIDISNYNFFSVSVEISEGGTLELGDYIRVEYNINETEWYTFETNGYIADDFGSATATQNNLSGNTLRLRITMINNDDNKIHYADNIVVIGSNTLIYCSASTLNQNDEYISRVELGSIDNPTDRTSGGYADYTSLSTDITIGTSYSVTVTNGEVYTGDQCGIWIDWNQDGDFNDASETISVTGGLTIFSATITPPYDAALGSTRLRTRITYTGVFSACGTTQYGEVEDYTVNVLPCTAPDVPTVSASSATICSGDNIALTITGNLNSASEWVVYSGSCGGTQIGTTTTNTFIISNVSATTTYYVRGEGSSCDGTQCGSVTVTVNPSGAVGVSISVDPPGAVCTGTNVTYTATPTNGGSNPSYQWKVNGENVGINSNVYSYVPNDDDQVSCILTSNLQCATGSATVPITYFSWDDNTKAITDSDIGLDAVSIGGGQYLPGGIGGTTALGPITIPKTDIVLNLGNNSAYNSEGVDYSISYRRAESASQLFTRGSSLIISGGSVFNVSYRVDNEAGSFTTITSSNFNIADDDSFYDYRFTYDPSDGYGRLYINGTEVWTSSATPGKAIYWTGAGDLIIGANTDASGTLIPTFDNLSIKGISLKSAEDEVIQTLNPLPVINIQPLPLTVCEGESGNFTVATSASSPAYQWGFATSPTPASWIDVPEGGDISGTETNVLDVANILLGYNGVYVSCLIIANGCETRSSAVLLTVNPLPATGEIIPD